MQIPRKIPSYLSCYINYYQYHSRVQHLSYRINTVSVSTTEGVCDPKKDPMCPTTSTTINTTAEYNTSEYNTSATESTAAVNTTDVVCNPKKDSTCTATSTTINTTAEYNTSATESTVAVNTTEGVAKDAIPNTSKIPLVLLHQLLSIPQQSTTPQLQNPRVLLHQLLSSNRIHSKCQLSITAQSVPQGVCDPKKDPMCPATSTTISTTAEYNTSTSESTVSVSTTEEGCDPKKDPTCPATSTTINTTAEYNTSATESTVIVSTSEGVCDPKKDPTCPATSSAFNTTAEYNTSATESTVIVNATEGVCDPKKDPTCPATSTTINTIQHTESTVSCQYNTSHARINTVPQQLSMPQWESHRIHSTTPRFNATEGVCNPKKDPMCPATSTTINTTAEYNTSPESAVSTESKKDPVAVNTTEKTTPQLSTVSASEESPPMSCYINYYQLPQHLKSTTPQLQNQHINTTAVSTTEGVCDPKKDPTCPATSTTINTTAEYNTSATESTTSVSTTEGVCDPKKDPTCPPTSTTINTTVEYNTSATESTVQ
ncbi:uncharacterized protein [Macrobrachium rosenbergii]|uniref:uncharacterized protein n=1 Tax=Macrobrachium rosenbergii TaxID=79674 RepID=UPI0034D412BE